VVCGRLVNVYSRHNPALAFLYRTDHPLSKDPAGLGPIDSPHVENLDASPHVPTGSDAYHFALPAVLDEAGLLADR
jgi:hypothetical protein